MPNEILEMKYSCVTCTILAPALDPPLNLFSPLGSTGEESLVTLLGSQTFIQLPGTPLLWTGFSDALSDVG